ncbi:MAG: hypothetical protein CL555_06000 [Algoriphagus sp.]|nr:hypothetical protein [Algoriphagus sp.]
MGPCALSGCAPAGKELRTLNCPGGEELARAAEDGAFLEGFEAANKRRAFVAKDERGVGLRIPCNDGFDAEPIPIERAEATGRGVRGKDKVTLAVVPKAEREEGEGGAFVFPVNAQRAADRGVPIGAGPPRLRRRVLREAVEVGRDDVLRFVLRFIVEIAEGEGVEAKFDFTH